MTCVTFHSLDVMMEDVLQSINYVMELPIVHLKRMRMNRRVCLSTIQHASRIPMAVKHLVLPTADAMEPLSNAIHQKISEMKSKFLI